MHVDTTCTTIPQAPDEGQEPPFTSTTLPNSTPPSPTPIPLSEPLDSPSPASSPHRLFLDLFAGHSAPLSVAARAAQLDSFQPFDIEFDHLCDILNDDLFETLLKIACTGLVGAIWSAPPCKLYSRLRKNDGGPPPLHSAEFMDGLPNLTQAQVAAVQESLEIHRRSSVLCTAVCQQGGFAAQEQPIDSLAWKEPFHQSFLTQCSCHLVSTPACKFGLDWYKTWAVAATSERIHLLAGNCRRHTHYSVRGKRLPDGTYISSLTVEYPSPMASAIMDIIRPGSPRIPTSTAQSYNGRPSLPSNPFLGVLASRTVQATSVRPTGLYPSARMSSKQSVRNGLLAFSPNTSTHMSQSSRRHTTEPFISDDDLIPFIQDLQTCFPSETRDTSIPPFQPFRLQLFQAPLVLSQDPDHHIAELLQTGIPSGALSPLAPTNLWEKNTAPPGEIPDLHICQDNWMSANQNPQVTTDLIQAELEAGFIEEIPDLPTAEKRWPQGIALRKLGVVYAENRDPRLVLDSTVCGMNGRCHLPERQKLPNLRHISFFLSSCP